MAIKDAFSLLDSKYFYVNHNLALDQNINFKCSWLYFVIARNVWSFAKAITESNWYKTIIYIVEQRKCVFDRHVIYFFPISHLNFRTFTDTSENVQKWTRVSSTRRWVILVARTRRKKRRKILASTLVQIRLWTSFESSPVSVNLRF